MSLLDNSSAIQTSNVSLTNTEASLLGSTTSIVLTENLQYGRTAPIGLAVIFLPQVTGIAAGATVTINVRAGNSASGTLIGTGVTTNEGAGTAASGPVAAMTVVPAGSGQVWFGGVTSTSTATAPASATSPIVACVFYFD